MQVMDLLGTSLYELHRFCNFKFSLKTTLMLTEQLLARLEWVHGRGVLHNDIKPLNFTMGVGTNVRIAMPRCVFVACCPSHDLGLTEQATKVYLIDFGLATRLEVDPTTGQYKPQTSGGFKIKGTRAFQSPRAHSVRYD